MANDLNRPPVILLNMAVDVVNKWESEIIFSNYVSMVSDAGAVPVCMPSIEKEQNIETLLDIADGVLLIGGKDYHPSYYGRVPSRLRQYHPGRRACLRKHQTEKYHGLHPR